MNRNSKDKGGVILAALKGNQDVSGNAIKANGVGVVMEFVSRAVPGCELYGDRCSFVLVMPDIEGDATWINDNVLKYVDVLGTSTQGEVERRAERMISLYQEAGGPEAGAAGWGIVRSVMDKFGMLGSCASMYRRG